MNHREILVFNAGSSSLKVSLYRGVPLDGGLPPCQATGEAFRIGGDGGVVLSIPGGHRLERTSTSADHGVAAETLIALLEEAGVRPDPARTLIAHRLVHGGSRSAPCIIDDAVMAELHALGELAPLHNPPALRVVEVARRAFGPEPRMVAAFDTAFFARLPDRAGLYAIPLDLAERHGIRRYGFHGLAHAHMTERAAALLERDASELRLVTLQLGNGCSAAAVDRGTAVDTTMGMTPLEGLVMGTRSGDIDPAVVPLLMRKEGLSAPDVVTLLNKRSGLLGLSGLSADMVDLAEAEAASHAGARLAREMFVYRVRKQIGAYIAALGGVDAIVFGGGIGERAADIRQRICDGLEPLGLAIDPTGGEVLPGEDGEIGDPTAPVRIFVVAVDEMATIARQARRGVMAATGE